MVDRDSMGRQSEDIGELVGPGVGAGVEAGGGRDRDHRAGGQGEAAAGRVGRFGLAQAVGVHGGPPQHRVAARRAEQQRVLAVGQDRGDGPPEGAEHVGLRRAHVEDVVDLHQQLVEGAQLVELGLDRDALAQLVQGGVGEGLGQPDAHHRGDADGEDGERGDAQGPPHTGGRGLHDGGGTDEHGDGDGDDGGADPGDGTLLAGRFVRTGHQGRIGRTHLRPEHSGGVASLRG